MPESSQQESPVYTVIVSEKGGHERREVFRSGEVTVGRVHGNDLVLPRGNVYKRHARVLYREGRFIVADLNSTNGTYVNRRRIAQVTIIREDDRVYVGDFVVRVISTGPSSQDSEVAPPTPTANHDIPDGGTLKPEAGDAAHLSSSSSEELTGSSEASRAPAAPVSSTGSRVPSSIPRGFS